MFWDFEMGPGVKVVSRINGAFSKNRPYREKKKTKPGCRGRSGLGKTTLVGGFFFKPSLIMFVCQLLTFSLNINSCLAVRARFPFLPK